MAVPSKKVAIPIKQAPVKQQVPPTIDSFNAAGVEWLSVLNGSAKGDNILISPLSLSLALWMIYQGAETSTASQLAEILKLPQVTVEKNNDYLSQILKTLTNSTKAEFLCSNSVWIKELTLKSEFKKSMEDYFQATVAPLESSEKIDDWVTKTTKGKITSIGPIPPSITFVLINAIYFKGIFQTPFDPKQTLPGKFTTSNSAVIDIDMMRKTDDFEFVNSKTYSSLKLKYAGTKPSFECLLFLPKDSKTSPSSLLKTIFVNNQLEEKYAKTKVKVVLPRFSVKYDQTEFLDVLTSQGLKNKGFDKIASELLILDKVIHKTTLEMNEEGTVAAAVTVVSARKGGVIREIPEFIADRPFLLILRDSESKTILFLGEITNPKPLTASETVTASKEEK